MTRLKGRSYAKVNLTLKILGVRLDGFHELESIMQNVSLFGGISFSETAEGVEIACDDRNVPLGRQNICFRAADFIMRKYHIDKGVKIEIKKNIPMEAGLGGGSSNAAATIIALNKLWDIKMNEKEMISIAAHVGSDVPFFIAGGRAMCKGRGEKIEKIEGAYCPPAGRAGNTPIHYLIVKPDVAVVTKWAYEEWDKVSTKHKAQNPKQIQSSNIKIQNEEYYNDLEKVVISKYPQIGDAIEDLLRAGCSYAQMTGSGSAVFGIVDDNDKGEKILKEIKDKYSCSFLTSEVDKGVELVAAS